MAELLTEEEIARCNREHDQKYGFVLGESSTYRKSMLRKVTSPPRFAQLLAQRMAGELTGRELDRKVWDWVMRPEEMLRLGLAVP